MTIEFDKFKKLAQDFISVSAQLGDEWVLKTVKIGEVEDIYLEKRIIKHDSKKHEEACNGNANEIPVNASFTVFVYHIVYSPSYSVPVLCFNAHHADGRLLSLEDIWTQIPDCYQSVDPNGRWNIITQQEHPKLGIPCFMFHPCHTKDLVPCYTSANYIISWLSIVGPLAGLNAPLEYAKFC